MTTPVFKPSEGKREEFRKYLEKNGVLDALTKVLVNLYEEVDKPEDALEYIRDKLAIHAGMETLGQMKEQLDEAHNRIAELEKQLEDLTNEQFQHPPEAEEPQGDYTGDEGLNPDPGEEQDLAENQP